MDDKTSINQKEDNQAINENELPPKDKIVFGHGMKAYFPQDPDYINVNFGSLGSPCLYALNARNAYTSRMNSNTDRWFRFEIFTELDETRNAISRFINADASDLVIVDNATEAANSILRSFPFNAGDEILYFDIAFSNVESLLKYMQNTKKVKLVKLNLTEERIQSKDKIIQYTKEFLDNYQGNIKFAIIDHIPSTPTFIMPIKELIDLFKKKNIVVAIDGAHAVGQIPINIKELDPDFYFSNFHKWGFNCRGSCFLYVKNEIKTLVHPVIISFYYKKSFQKEFDYKGTKDIGPWLSIKQAIEFIEHIGFDRICEHNRKLALEAGRLVAKIWNTSLLINNDEMACNMVNVLLPIQDRNLIKKLQPYNEYIYEKYKTILFVFEFSNGKFYARISAQIMNELQDYKIAAEALLDFMKVYGNQSDT